MTMTGYVKTLVLLLTQISTMTTASAAWCPWQEVVDTPPATARDYSAVVELDYLGADMYARYEIRGNVYTTDRIGQRGQWRGTVDLEGVRNGTSTVRSVHDFADEYGPFYTYIKPLYVRVGYQGTYCPSGPAQATVVLAAQLPRTNAGGVYSVWAASRSVDLSPGESLTVNIPLVSSGDPGITYQSRADHDGAVSVHLDERISGDSDFSVRVRATKPGHDTVPITIIASPR